MALYRSEVLPREIPKRFNGVSRQTVEAKVKQLVCRYDEEGRWGSDGSEQPAQVRQVTGLC